MEPKYWYIAIVPNNGEAKAAEILANEYEVFLPAQKIMSVWKDGRRKLRNKIVLPGKLLIHCTEAERQQTMQYSFVHRYMVDIASSPNQYGRRSAAIVPDDQVELLRFMLGQPNAKIDINNTNIQTGETVRVIRGAFCGLEGIVIDRTVPKTKLHIQINHLGFACTEVNVNDIERK